MDIEKNKVCQLCNEESQHTKTCQECGLIFCPCSQIVGVDIIVEVGPKCPNCGSIKVVSNKK